VTRLYICKLLYGSVPVNRLLLKLGFYAKLAIKKYWYEDSIIYGYSCPECGNPCICEAVIYEAKLNN